MSVGQSGTPRVKVSSWVAERKFLIPPLACAPRPRLSCALPIVAPCLPRLRFHVLVLRLRSPDRLLVPCTALCFDPVLLYCASPGDHLANCYCFFFAYSLSCTRMGASGLFACLLPACFAVVALLSACAASAVRSRFGSVASLASVSPIVCRLVLGSCAGSRVGWWAWAHTHFDSRQPPKPS